MYWKNNHKTDEELEEVLKEKFSQKINSNRDKKHDMVQFFSAMKDKDPDQEQKMQQVLYGGRGDKKRHYAVDETLYGTEEGVKRRGSAQDERKLSVDKRKVGKKKKRKKKIVETRLGSIESETTAGGKFSIESKAVATIGAVSTLAICALLVGGKRS